MQAQWTEYGTDNWQEIEGAVIRHGTGQVIIPQAWFADKPNRLCFRITDVRLMDHRGIFPASLINKTTDAFEALKYVMCTTSGGRGTYSGGAYASHQWEILRDESDCDILPPQMLEANTGDGYTGENAVIIKDGADPSPGGRAVVNSISVSFASLNSFGPPKPLWFFPDGTEILSAVAEISGGGISLNGGDPVDCSYAFIGFTGPSAFDILPGTLPSAVNGQKVYDVLSLIQTMFAERATNKYAYGYGTIILPPGFDGGEGLEAMVPPGPPDTITDVNPLYPCGSRTTFAPGTTDKTTWSGVTISNIVLEVQYPAAERERMLIQPRWPSMA